MNSKSKSTYNIPKNKCQYCYKLKGRFIMDCYCILCPDCFPKLRCVNGICGICGRPTKAQFIDTANKSTIKEVEHLFGNVENNLNRVIEVYKFQQTIDSRYCRYLESQLNHYKAICNELAKNSSEISDFIAKRLLGNKDQTERMVYSKSVNHYDQNQTTKYYPPNSSRSNSSLNNYGIEVVRVNQQDKYFTGKQQQQIYKPSNINYHTAQRSSKRPSKQQYRIDEMEYEKMSRRR